MKKPYSIDENIWGTAIECGVLEDPMAEPPADAYLHTVDPALAPDNPAYRGDRLRCTAFPSPWTANRLIPSTWS